MCFWFIPKTAWMASSWTGCVFGSSPKQLEWPHLELGVFLVHPQNRLNGLILTGCVFGSSPKPFEWPHLELGVFLVHTQNSLNGLILNWVCFWFIPKTAWMASSWIGCFFSSSPKRLEWPHLELDVFLVHPQNGLNGLILNWCTGGGCWFFQILKINLDSFEANWILKLGFNLHLCSSNHELSFSAFSFGFQPIDLSTLCHIRVWCPYVW
jgi:hypothetical protein